MARQGKGIRLPFVVEDKASTTLKNVSTSLKNVKTAAGTTNTKVRALQNSMKDAKTHANNLRRESDLLGKALKFGGIAAGTASIAALGRAALDTAGRFETLRTSLDVMSKGHGMQIFKALEDWALTQPISTEAAITSFKNLKAYGLEPTIESMQTLVDASLGLGSGVDGMNGIARALGQIQAKGKVSAEELMQLTERGIPAYAILEEKLDLNKKQIGNIGNEAIDAGRAIDALYAGMDERYSGMASMMQGTWVGLTTTTKSYFEKLATMTIEGSGLLEVMKDDVKNINEMFAEGIESGNLQDWADNVALIAAGLRDAAGGAMAIGKAITWPQRQLNKMYEWLGSKAGENLKQNNPAAYEWLKGMMPEEGAVEKLLRKQQFRSVDDFAAQFVEGIRGPAKVIGKPKPPPSLVPSSAGASLIGPTQSAGIDFGGLLSLGEAGFDKETVLAKMAADANAVYMAHSQVLEKMQETVPTLKEMAEASNDFTRGAELGITSLVDEYDNMGMVAFNTSRQIGDAMTNNIGQGIHSVIMGTGDMGDAFAAMGSQVLSILTQVAAEMLIVKSIMAGASLFSSGQSVADFGVGAAESQASFGWQRYLKRQHDGGMIGADERLFIGQVGEAVISRDAVARNRSTIDWLLDGGRMHDGGMIGDELLGMTDDEIGLPGAQLVGGAPHTEINIINNTGQQFNAKQGASRRERNKFVQDIVLEAAYKDMDFNRALGGALGRS